MSETIFTPLSPENYQEEVAKCERAVVYISAPWCGPCKTYKPLLQQQLTNHLGRISAFSVDAEAHRDFAVSQLNLRTVPTTIFYQNGNITSIHSGVVSASALEALLAKHAE